MINFFMGLIKWTIPSIDKKSYRKLILQYQEEGMTVIHCSYVSPDKYFNGGWVNIHKTTYLVQPGGGELGLLHAENIPLAPRRHIFEKAGVEKRFTLYFPLLPKNWDSFDFVERTPSATGFVIRNICRNDSGVYEVRLG